MPMTTDETQRLATVYTTRGGRRFHADENCRALHAGQDLYGGWGTYTTYRTEATNPTAAFGDGKDPCTVCIPGFLAAIYRSDSENDFGHVPVSDDREFFGEVSDDPPVCGRCAVTIRQAVPVCVGQDAQGRFIAEERWISYEEAVAWPCTSAIVLGLAARPTP